MKGCNCVGEVNPTKEAGLYLIIHINTHILKVKTLIGYTAMRSHTYCRHPALSLIHAVICNGINGLFKQVWSFCMTKIPVSRKSRDLMGILIDKVNFHHKQTLLSTSHLPTHTHCLLLHAILGQVCHKEVEKQASCKTLNDPYTNRRVFTWSHWPPLL